MEKLYTVNKNTEELYKKGLNDPDNHDGVVTTLNTYWSMKS